LKWLNQLSPIFQKRIALEIAPNKQLGKEIDDYTDRLNALKQIIEG